MEHYRLHVHYPGEELPREVQTFDTSTSAINAIPGLLSRHKRCERVVVLAGSIALFAIDHAGNWRRH